MIRTLLLWCTFFSVACTGVAVPSATTGVTLDLRNAPFTQPHGIVHPRASTVFKSASFTSAWLISEWDWDPSNSTGFASDTVNSCTTVTAPCLTVTAIQQKIGTYSPRWAQNVLLRQMSPAVNPQDLLYLNALIENGAVVQYMCVPTVVCSGTIAALVPRNTAVGQRIEMPICGTPAKDELVVNNTHSSHAWTDSLVSGSTWVLSNPVLPINVPWNGSDVPQVAWSNGDSYSLEKLPTSYVGSFQPTVIGGYTPGISGAYMINCDVQSPPGNAYAEVPFSGGAVYVDESIFDQNVYSRFDSIQLGNSSAVFNSVAEEPITTTANPYFMNQFGWKGGILRQPYGTTVSMYIENGTYLEGNIYVAGAGYLRDTYVASGAYVVVNGYVGVAFGSGGSAGLWGPGNLYIVPPSLVNLVGGAVLDLQYLTGSIYINGKTAACTLANSASPNLNCAVPITATNLDANGFLYSPAGAAIITPSSPF
jgi:hypothetical protein